MFGGRKNLLGVDIGSAGIKIALVEGPKERVRVRDLWMDSLPPEAIAEGDIMERDRVLSGLKKYLERKKPPTKNVSTFLTNPRAINIKRVRMDKLPPEEVKEQAKWQAEQYFGVDPTEISVDGDIVDPDVSETEMEILLVAARNDAILDYLSIIRAAGYNPKVLDVQPFAVYNVFEYNYPETASSGELVGLIHIGSAFSFAIYLKGKGPYLIRDLRIGSKDAINLLQERQNLSYEESDKILKGEEEPSALTLEVFREFSNMVSEEVRKTFPYLEYQEKPDRLFVSGGGSLVPGLIDNMSDTLGVKVDRLNPFEKIVLSETFFSMGSIETIGSIFTPALGLSLRGVL
jgi:type IV pilus assembly protein PilM